MAKTFTFSSATVTRALNAAHAYGKEIAELRAEALEAKLSKEEVKAGLMEPVAKYYDVDLRVKERGEGKTWDKKAVNYSAAVKAHQRLVDGIVGSKTKGSDETEIPPEVLAAAAKLVKLANKATEKGARSLASKALAAAWAK